MAHGEAEHGCAQDEPCRMGHDQPRRVGLTHPGEPAAGWTPERADEDAAVPRQRSGEPAHPAVEPASDRSCLSDQGGWAGGHQHGAVRPRNRTVRRERPPRRWC
ncbi:hypothetical protein O7602_06225 [Micromonospora sp. WMMD1128]|uniref:hypothetical protein n=1 Tax=unclassified Micromonospora TaxID=2617518 RepID=UPI00248BA8BF|nr:MULTISPECIES: hypothetical protein [unclassified Micromonospora]WBB75124.1 hypothetical protein O7602_06225 [Micromonospora sp. WMMD1128]WFE31500.1 hypothetical protein O7613_17960 [Micromonospora sp. WMMD975]